MACATALRTVGSSTFIGCACHPDHWVSTARGLPTALAQITHHSRMGNMVTDNDMLTVSEEAEAVGRHVTMVSRRRSNDPSHPANQPGADSITVGKRTHTRAPRAAVVAYWASVQKGAGRPKPRTVPGSDD